MMSRKLSNSALGNNALLRHSFYISLFTPALERPVAHRDLSAK
jgi:hypothetical protein